MEAVLLELGSLRVTAFSLCVMAAAVLALSVLYTSMRGLGRDVWAVFAAWCLPLGLLGARLFYALARINHIIDLEGVGSVLRLWEGGYAFFGAVGGCALAGWIAAKRTGKTTGTILDTAAPALLLFLALCRFAEGFSGQGFGLLVNSEALRFFPLAVQNEYGEWNFAIFIAEGLTALGVFLLSIRRFKSYRALKTLIVITAAQILWESMRRDAFLRWGFVRVAQLAAVLVLFGVLLTLCVRRVRAGERLAFSVARIGGFAVFTGVCIALEFAMDKSPLPYGWAWLMMAAAAIALGALPWRLLRKPMQANQ